MKHLISLYDEDTKDFKNNGEYILNNIITDDNIEWGLHDQWSLTFSIPVNNPLGITISPNQIVKAPTPNFDEPQLFYINYVERTLDEIEVRAVHIYNKIKHIFLPNSLVRERGLVDAVNQIILYKGLDYPFEVKTDKGNRRVDAHYVRMNALQAISDESLDHSVITQTETEFTANNFELQLLNRIGKDRGADIRYGRDLLSFKETIDTSEAIGRVVPVGNNGFTIPESDGGPYVKYKGYNPSIHMTEEIEYNEVKADYGEGEGEEDALPVNEAVRQLKRLGEREFTLANIHQPLISYELDMYDLRNEFEGLQKIRPGDSILIIDNKQNEIKERLIGYSYSPTTMRYTSMTLANKTPEITALERKKKIHGGGTLTT